MHSFVSQAILIQTLWGLSDGRTLDFVMTVVLLGVV